MKLFWPYPRHNMKLECCYVETDILPSVTGISCHHFCYNYSNYQRVKREDFLIYWEAPMVYEGLLALVETISTLLSTIYMSMTISFCWLKEFAGHRVHARMTSAVVFPVCLNAFFPDNRSELMGCQSLQYLAKIWLFGNGCYSHKYKWFHCHDALPK